MTRWYVRSLVALTTVALAGPASGQQPAGSVGTIAGQVVNAENRTPIVYPPGVVHPHYVGINEPPTVVTLDEVRAQVLLWRDIEWIRSLTKMPMLLKGIMNAADAETGLKAGADGIMVSNHGGRCLDTQPATIEALPGVVRQVNGRVPVIVDGGIRRGTDVVKALALGADLVGLGRMPCFGLAAAGAAGCVRMLELLEDEIRVALALLGVDRIGALDASYLHPAPPVALPSVYSAFPLLDGADY